MALLWRKSFSIGWHGNADASEQSRRLRRAFVWASWWPWQLPRRIRNVPGMSGQRYRALINRLVASTDNARYLEIGSWKGSTVTAALHGNRATAVCIDNWSEFGGPREQFYANIELVKSDKVTLTVLEQDFRTVDYRGIGRFNVYMFDGPHGEQDQYDGVVLAQPALDDRYVLIVDDWNWPGVRAGTMRALEDLDATVEFSVVVRTTQNGTHAPKGSRRKRWHNGYFIGSICKRGH